MKHLSNNSRRNFIKKTGKAGIALTLSNTLFSSVAFSKEKSFLGNDDPINFQQQPLPYTYNALEPFVDAPTMEIHYTKHANNYAKNLADAVAAESVNIQKDTLQKVLGAVSKYSTKMRNNAGGHYNHELFWRSMTSNGKGKPESKLLQAIERHFNSFDAFKTQFTEAAKNRFGSGWAWLIWKEDKLVITSTPNQDNPLMDVAEIKGFPLLGLDVWEHAYYLKYQNKRPDYINAWWNVVNWDFVGNRFEQNT